MTAGVDGLLRQEPTLTLAPLGNREKLTKGKVHVTKTGSADRAAKLVPPPRDRHFKAKP
jgi:hypothetical protein